MKDASLVKKNESGKDSKVIRIPQVIKTHQAVKRTKDVQSDTPIKVTTRIKEIQSSAIEVIKKVKDI
jgi:hypothetical protein